MSLEMGVVPSGAELSRAATVALLSSLIGDDPDLHDGVANGEFAELDWQDDRISTQWSVHPGSQGISSVVVSIWDAYPMRPAAGYRTAVTPIIDLLQELAQATDGRFIVEEGDFTGAPIEDVLDLVSPDDEHRTPTGMVIEHATESDEDYLRRYLAAGDERLAWLAGRLALTAGPLPLDRSRDSLVPLWGWAIGRLRPRPADAPREKVILQDGSVLQRPTDAVLPMWYGRSVFLAPAGWSDDSLALLDAIAFYAAECVRRAVPELSWQVAHDAVRGYQHEGQPVLAGHGPDLEPITALVPLGGRMIYQLRHPDPDTRDPRTPPSSQELQDWFDGVVAQRR